MKPTEVKPPQVIETIEREGFGYKDFPKLDLKEIEIIKDFDEKHSQYKQIVKEILEYYPYATNNDFILQIEFLRVLGLLEVTSGKDNFTFKIPRDKIKFIPSPESITRARRSLIQECFKKENFALLDKIVPQNPNVLKRRMKRERLLKIYFSREK